MGKVAKDVAGGGKQKGTVLLQDNARNHSSKVARQKVDQLGIEVLPHPPYSPDLPQLTVTFSEFSVQTCDSDSFVI